MKRVVAVLAAAGIVLSGLVTPAVAAPVMAPERAGSITWGACSLASLKAAHAECGDLRVPLDYGKPNGAKVLIALSRIKHTVPDSQYQGIMLVNPGGPGAPGLELSQLGGLVPNHAGDAYDWIGFDPRGVGSSKPALRCVPDYFGYNRPNYIPSTPELERTWLSRSKQYADTCGKKGEALLDHMKTTDVAHDMDAIRVALGQQQINFYGFSYGTYLGQVYSTLFPTHMRRMVLDSNVDPRRVWYQAGLDQAIAFDRNIKVWFAWVAKHDNIFHLGNSEATVEKLFYVQRDALGRQPAGGLIGPDEWSDIFLQAGYYRMTWVDLGNAFANWVHQQDWQDLKALYDQTMTPGDDNQFAVYNAVSCTDVQWPLSWDKWRADNWRVHAKAPFATWLAAWFSAPCLYWPAKAGTPTKIDGSKVAGALLIGEELDAATPFTGSLEVRRLYPNASLIGEPGGGTHADSLEGDACVDNKVADYLATGKLPPRVPGNKPDALCAPLPDPILTASTAQPQSQRATAQAGRTWRLRPHK